MQKKILVRLSLSFCHKVNLIFPLRVGRWTQEEHDLFMQGLKIHRKQWKLIADLIKTRTVVQIRTHAQKYFQKVMKLKSTGDISIDDINSFIDSHIMSTVKHESGEKIASVSPSRVKRKPVSTSNTVDGSFTGQNMGGEFSDTTGNIRVQRSMSLSTFEEVILYSYFIDSLPHLYYIYVYVCMCVCVCACL